MDIQNCFLNDYNQVAHPAIVEAVSKALTERHSGYGLDSRTEKAKAMIRRMIGNNDVDIHLMVGGTQTNLIAINAFLRPYEAVISAKTAHINVHETGAIEATGHKILSFESADGKLTAEDIHTAMAENQSEHMVMPRLVFISQATESGTVYRKNELIELRKVCDEFGLLLYIDGARIGYSLTSAISDCTLEDIARLADAFYIGGTKNGLLFGEALVIVNPAIKENFRYHIKQRGGLLAKGFLLGIQFEALFENNLYFELARHANEMAEKLKNGIKKLGYDFLVDSPTNQLFPILDVVTAEQLKEYYALEEWGKTGEDKLAVRLVTTWSTDEEDIFAFLNQLKIILKSGF